MILLNFSMINSFLILLTLAYHPPWMKIINQLNGNKQTKVTQITSVSHCTAPNTSFILFIENPSTTALTWMGVHLGSSEQLAARSCRGGRKSWWAGRPVRRTKRPKWRRLWSGKSRWPKWNQRRHQSCEDPSSRSAHSLWTETNHINSTRNKQSKSH